MDRRRAFVLAAAAALTAGAVAACSSSDAPARAEAEEQGPPPALVSVAEVTAGALEDGWRFLGQVEPSQSAELAAAVDGHVVSVEAHEGDRVARGAPLVRLDAALAAAELARSRAAEKKLEAQLAQARRQLDRIADTGAALSEPERERFALDVATFEADLATQRAESKRYQVEVGRHTVRAPFDGVVKARHVDPGAWVATGEAVLELVSLDNLEILVDVSVELGGRLSEGDTATLVGATRAEATVVGVVPALSRETRTMRVRLTVAERPEWLLAGMAVDVEFQVALSGSGVLVPRDALVRGPVDVRVIEYADGKGLPVTVEVLATAKDRALVRGEGLDPGDKVVTRGNERLRPGQPLRLAE